MNCKLEVVFFTTYWEITLSLCYPIDKIPNHLRNQLSTVTASQLGNMTTQQVKALTSAQVKTLSGAQIKGFSDLIQSLEPTALGAISTAAITSLITPSKWRPARTMRRKLSAEAAGSRARCSPSCAKPRTALSGVRISWLILARNCVLTCA